MGFGAQLQDLLIDFWWPQLQQDWEVQPGFFLGTAELRDCHLPAGKGTLSSHPTPQECSRSDGKGDGCSWQCTQSVAPAKQDLGVLCKVVLKENLPQHPASTHCPELRLCLATTRLTAVEVKRSIHHMPEREKQRSPSPRPGAAQLQGFGDSWTGLNFIVY